MIKHIKINTKKVKHKKICLKCQLLKMNFLENAIKKILGFWKITLQFAQRCHIKFHQIHPNNHWYHHKPTLQVHKFVYHIYIWRNLHCKQNLMQSVSTVTGSLASASFLPTETANCHSCSTSGTTLYLDKNSDFGGFILWEMLFQNFSDIKNLKISPLTVHKLAVKRY